MWTGTSCWRVERPEPPKFLKFYSPLCLTTLFNLTGGSLKLALSAVEGRSLGLASIVRAIRSPQTQRCLKRHAKPSLFGVAFAQPGRSSEAY